MSIPVELMREVVDMMLSEKKIASLALDTRVRNVGQATYRTIKEALFRTKDDQAATQAGP